MIKGVRHIIFDLGGVLLNIDYKRTEDAFVQAGITNFAELYTQAAQTQLFSDFETGKITSEEFVAAIQKLCPQPITEQQIIDCWNAMLLDFPVRRLQILQQLCLYYDLFLLSNTNAIHEEAFNDILFRQHGIPTIGVFFHKAYYSHHVGLRKPSPEIFELILKEYDLNPAHTLFIDDSEQHIATANQLGIQTIHLTPDLTIEKDIFKNR
jgi:putative hydrolase of the HAD superfamily